MIIMPDINEVKKDLEKIDKGALDDFLDQKCVDWARKGKSFIDTIIKSGGDPVGAFVRAISDDERRISPCEEAIKSLAVSKCMDTRAPFYKYIYQGGKFKFGQFSNYTVRYNVKKYLEEKGERGLLILEKLGSDKLSDKLEAFIALVVSRYLHVKEEEDKPRAGDARAAASASKRPHLPLSDVPDEKVEEELSAQWQQNKSSETGSRKSLAEIAGEADYAQQELQRKGILFERDNSRTQVSGQGLSENFVKLFIRYLERKYPDLKDFVDIYYHQSPTVEPYEAGESEKKYYQAYWDKVKRLEEKSKTNDRIYIVVNQGVVELGGEAGKNEGHANLTIIYNGGHRVFDSVPHQYWKSTGTDERAKVTSDALQKDGENCVTIALGYMESLMKKISQKRAKIFQKKGKSVSGETSGEEQKFGSSLEDERKVLSGKFAHSVDKYFDERPLLPPEYIKYSQYSDRIESIIESVEKMTGHEKDYKKWKKVAAELKKVGKKYSWAEQPAEDFLRSFVKVSSDREGVLSDFIPNLIKSKVVDEPITTGKLYDLMKNKELSEELLEKKYMGEDVCIDMYINGETDKPLLGYVREELKNNFEKELMTKPVYRGMNVDDPRKLTLDQLAVLDAVERGLGYALKMKPRAQAKRYTETLKVATLVDILKRNGIDVDEEMGKVKRFLGDDDLKS